MPLTDYSSIPSINFDIDEYREMFGLYKSDLEKYINSISGERSEIASYAKRYLLNELERKWIPLLGFDHKRISSDIQELQTPKTEFVSSMTLGEALQYYKSGSSWLIPNMLREASLYLLAGEPKAGKSLLLYFLIYAVAVSGSFLGRPVKTGKVLYIQLEENLQTIGERLFMAGFGNLEDEDTSLAVNFMNRVEIHRVFDITVDINWLINKIKEFQPTLVVIDSLRMASLNSNVSENTNEFGKLVYRLQQVFNFTNTCGVVIHHMSKLGGRNAAKTSLIERLAGHTSISGGTDGIIGISAEEGENGRVMTLKTLPRDGTPLTIKYQLNTGEENLWKLEKIWEDTPINNPFTNKILRFLAANVGEEFTATQMARSLETNSNDVNFKQSLSYLKNNQIIKHYYKNRRFLYSLESDSLWLVNPQSIKDLVSPAVLDANLLMRCENKRQVRELVKDWNADRTAEASQSLLVDERERLRALIKSWEFEIGDVVLYQGQRCGVLEKCSEKPTLTSNYYMIENFDTPIIEQDLEVFDIEALGEDDSTFVFEEEDENLSILEVEVEK